MKHVIYRNRTSQLSHRKIVSINEFNQDSHVRTHVQKGFLYHIVPVDGHDLGDQDPQIYVQKRVDNKTQTEEFCFRVKGSFVTMNDGHIVRVEFSHKLKIIMVWKDKKDFSPKKSVTLT